MNISAKRCSAYFLALFSLCFCNALETPADQKKACIAQFSDVLELVVRTHVSKPNYQDLVDKALAGMLSSLDPHSCYMVDEEAREYLQNAAGKLTGIGVRLRIAEDGASVIVTSPISGSPGEKAGLKAGDKIISVDGKLVKDIGYEATTRGIKGRAGTKVNLAVKREGQPKIVEFSIVRECINYAVVHSSFHEGLAYIQITEFSPETTSETKQVIKALEQEKKPLKGIILDLRNNPGGSLDQAVSLSEYFIDCGPVVGVKGREGVVEEMTALRSAPKAPKVPVVVLINGFSASASEVVAGAMQARGRAVIVGSKSYGKGSVQNIFNAKSNRLVVIKLTTALFCTPDGTFVDKKGIIPDIVVEDCWPPYKFHDSKSLQAELTSDKQYKKACEIINLINKLSYSVAR